MPVEVTVAEQVVTVDPEVSTVTVSEQASPVTVDAPELPVTVDAPELLVEVDEVEEVVNVTVVENPVTVTVQTEPEVEVTVDEPVVNVDVSEPVVDVQVTENPVTVEVGLNVQTVSGPSFLQHRIAGESLSTYDVVTINSSNALVRANPLESLGLWEAIGVVNANYTAGQSAGFFSYGGRLTPVKFAVAPLASDNGKVVYLSALGVASVTPPSVLAGNAIVKLGLLSGADGLTTTPEVVLNPEYVDVETFSKRFTLSLSHRGRIVSSGVQYLFEGDVATSLVPVTMPTDVILDGAAIRVERADPNSDFTLRILVGGSVAESVLLESGETFASGSGFADFIASGTDIQSFVERTSGSGVSAFFSVTSVLTFRGV